VSTQTLMLPSSHGQPALYEDHLIHLKANPAHLDYQEYITRPYRAEAGAWL
jgi:hypothetical protein